MRIDIEIYVKLSRIDTLGSKEDVLCKLSLRKFLGKMGKDNRQLRRYFRSNNSLVPVSLQSSLPALKLEILKTMISNIS